MSAAASQRTAVIFTALPVEMTAVSEHLEPNTVDDIVMDYVFEVGEFQDSGESWTVAVVELGPGNVETAAIVLTAANHFHPDVMLFVGIAGTLKADDAGLGDVVAGSAVSWSERAKETTGGRLHRPLAVDASHLLTQVARKIARRNTWQPRRKPVGDSGASYKAVVGQIASGEELVAAPEKKDSLRALLSDAVAVENEGYGFSHAARRAGRNLEFMVIRGISDAADDTKTDDFHRIAATSAAAFAFELLARLPSVESVPPTPDSAVSEDPGPKPEASESLASWFSKVLKDVDLIDDSQTDVIATADDLYSRGIDLSDGLIAVIEELETSTSSVLCRRLAWLAQRFVQYADTQEPPFLETDLVDEAVYRNPRGSSLALLNSATWTELPPRIKRRLTTAAFGSADKPHELKEEVAPLIIRLVKDDLLTDVEVDRFNRSMQLDDYGVLGKKGVPLPLLVERISDDIESGDFKRQNPASRHLYRTEDEIGTDTLAPEQDVRLGTALISAAEGNYPANGATEAVQMRRLVGWPESRLAGGLYAALTNYGRDTLRWEVTPHARNIVAAASTRDSLGEVLDLTAALIGSTLAHPQRADTAFLFEQLDEVEESLSSEDVPAFRSFKDKLQALLDE